jgi:hypothetical protein
MVRKLATYYLPGTRKRRPAVITGTALNDGLVLRVGHQGETYGDETTGILPREERTDTNVYTFI